MARTRLWNDLEIEIEDVVRAAELEILDAGLDAHSRGRVEPRDRRPLGVVAREQAGRLIGGLTGSTVWGWLHIERLWVAPDCRELGLGSEIVESAEAEAVDRGCRHAWVDTFSFQSVEFYRKLGYEIFGVLEDFPPGESRYFLEKRDLDGDRRSSRG